MKKIAVFILILLLILPVCSSTPDSSSKTVDDGLRTITDSTGRQVTIPEVVKSIVCVNVGSLRFTTYMQATDLVIGVEQNEIEPRISKPFSYINNDLFSTLPVMGDNGTTYDEEIVKLNPDVVIASIDKAAADALQEKLKIPVVAIPLIDNMFDKQCYELLTLMGEVYGREERAEELISYIKGLDADLKSRTKNIPEKQKPTVYAGGKAYGIRWRSLL